MQQGSYQAAAGRQLRRRIGELAFVGSVEEGGLELAVADHEAVFGAEDPEGVLQGDVQLLLGRARVFGGGGRGCGGWCSLRWFLCV